MTFIETFTISLLTSLLTGGVLFLKFRLDASKHRMDTMAETTARHFLLHKGYTDRSFAVLKNHLGGWDNNEDELRRILVRAGAVRSFRKSADGSSSEWWYLLERTQERFD